MLHRIFRFPKAQLDEILASVFGEGATNVGMTDGLTRVLSGKEEATEEVLRKAFTLFQAGKGTSLVVRNARSGETVGVTVFGWEDGDPRTNGIGR